VEKNAVVDLTEGLDGLNSGTGCFGEASVVLSGHETRLAV